MFFANMNSFMKYALPILFLVLQTVCADEVSGNTTEAGGNLPDLSDPFFQGDRSKLSHFNSQVMAKVKPLLQTFMDVPTDDFWTLSKAVEDKLSPSLHHDVLRLSLAHRPDVGGFNTSAIAQALSASNSENGNTQGSGATTVATKDIIILEYPSDGKNVEDRLSYYREDIGLNIFHQFWHLVYPFEIPADRKGEIFGYMHQQVIARYNFERLSNNMPRVLPLRNLREPIKEGYTPRLFGLTEDNFPARLPNSVLKDAYRPLDGIDIKVADVEKSREEVIKAIKAGFLVTEDGKKLPLDENALDLLFNTIQSNELTANFPLYGEFHNNIHMLLASIHDPVYAKKEATALIGTESMALKDPLFYRLHEEVDSIAQLFRTKLPPYKKEQLSFSGVTVKSVEVITEGSDKKNIFNTFMEHTDVLLLEGLDFDSVNKTATVRYTHNQHQPFTYNIQVENTGKERSGTCRVFLAPTLNEAGSPFTFNDQRLLAIEMDKFYVSLKPGLNKIERKSVDSTVTIPPEASFRDTTANEEDSQKFLGCGYPHSLLIPRGMKTGMKAQLFVMITDYELDKVEGVDLGAVGNNNALSICGLAGFKYPDKKPMGYPFDRLARQGVTTLKEFLTSNMAATDVSIKHS